MKTPEQLGPRASRRAGSAASFLKRRLSRLMRRLAKRNPEDAPRKRRYFGFFW